MLHNDSTAPVKKAAQSKSRTESPNEKFTVSLSPRTAEVIAELRELTDAATDSEVFRNAVRLHLTLLRAHIQGKQLLLRDSPESDTLTQITLFAAD